MPSRPKIQVKTDNRSLDSKCRLRRFLIQEAQLEPCCVLDLFAGEGGIWTELRRERHHSGEPSNRAVEVQRYTPVDMAKRQDGQIHAKITPRLIAAFNGDSEEELYGGSALMRYNVIDIDTYGDPWEIWQAVLFRIKTKTAVFLSRGRVSYGMAPGAGKMSISKLAKRICGIPEKWNVPGRGDLLAYTDRRQLLQECSTAEITSGYTIDHGRVEYYGLIVEPVIKPSSDGG
jgi:hypothetical protein